MAFVKLICPFGPPPYPPKNGPYPKTIGIWSIMLGTLEVQAGLWVSHLGDCFKWLPASLGLDPGGIRTYSCRKLPLMAQSGVRAYERSHSRLSSHGSWTPVKLIWPLAQRVPKLPQNCPKMVPKWFWFQNHLPFQKPQMLGTWTL